MSAFATLHARLLSLASAGFAAIGAYASAILAVKLGLPVFLSIPAASLLCGAVALVIGLPVLRLKDVYLAICTLGFGEIVRVAIILLPGLTGGPTGANLSTGFPYEAMRRAGSASIAIVLALLCYLFWATSKSKAGRALRAIRENPEVAETMGIDVVAAKNMAFLASALIAGLAGAFYAHTVGSLDAGDFKFSRAVDILGYAVLGGSGAWFGPLLGAGLLTALPILIRDGLGSSFGFLKDFAQLPNILSGLALMIVIIFAPGGLAALFSRPASRGGERDRAGDAQGRTSGPPRAALGSAFGGALGSAPSAPHVPLLRISGLSRSFGGLKALSDVEPRDRGGQGLRPHRPQRRRQDDPHQSRVGTGRAELRAHRVARPRDPGPQRLAHRPLGPGQELPACPALRGDERPRERHGRPARPIALEPGWSLAAAPLLPPGGGRGEGRGPRAPRGPRPGRASPARAPRPCPTGTAGAWRSRGPSRRGPGSSSSTSLRPA